MYTILQVDIPGPLGESAVKILESLPNLSLLNGVRASQILESNKHVIDSMLQPRLPEWIAGEPLAELVISAMWLYLMTYRLADEEKIDETSVWYAAVSLLCFTYDSMFYCFPNILSLTLCYACPCLKIQP